MDLNVLWDVLIVSYLIGCLIFIVAGWKNDIINKEKVSQGKVAILFVLFVISIGWPLMMKVNAKIERK